MSRRPLTILAVVTLTASLAGPLAAPAGAHGAHGVPEFHPGRHDAIALTTKAPYVPQATRRSYPAAPQGYRPVFTENVSRHGARTLSNSDDGDAVIALWKLAQAQGGLTRRGQGLGPEVQRLLDANAAIGYGNLTPLGDRELQQTAVRMQRRLPELFDQATQGTAEDPSITVGSSSQPRAIASAADYVAGLESVVPGLAPAVAPDVPNNDLLYFHEAKVNKDYQDYVANDPRVASAEAAARAKPQVVRAAREILERSFTPAFVDQIAAGDFSDEFPDAIAAGEAVYNLWAVTKDMPDEGPWHLDRYLTRDGEHWYGYLDDVTSFYENGPGFSGDDITYRMAGVLLSDIFGQLDAKVDGTSHLSAVLRFSHAEEVFPLAALLQLPGSEKQLPDGTLFTYADDPFRGATVAPMAANLQWDLFRRGDTYLVRMLYNEKPTAFKSTCRPVSPGSDFYELTALEHCYGY